MRNLMLGLSAVVVLSGNVLADDHTAVLNGTMLKIDDDGNLWRQKGSLWVEVRRNGTYRNTQRISASQTDGVLIVLQNDWLHAVNPETGGYTVLTRGLTYDPNKMNGLCGLNGYAYFIYNDKLLKVRLDGTGGLQPMIPSIDFPKTEGMAANIKSMVIVSHGKLYRLFENGDYKLLTPGIAWSGTTSIFAAAEDNYIITQHGVLHLFFAPDKHMEPPYVIVKP